MVKSDECLFDGRQIGVEEAKQALGEARRSRALVPIFFCTECSEQVDPHIAGNGSPARFEHRKRNAACSLSVPRQGLHRIDELPDTNWIDTAELAKRLAGGDAYIRTFRGAVKGLALRQDLNPEAPSVIVVGKGPQIEKRARLLLQSGTAVPT